MDCQKALFDIPEKVTYLNMAYMSPLPKETANIGIQALKKKLRPFEIGTSDFFYPVEQVKKQFSQLIGEGNHERIAIIPSVSYGVENACKNIPLEKGDEILIVEDQFPSHVYPWMEASAKQGAKMITIKAPKDIDTRGKEWNARILEAINANTKVVALPHVHWSEGIVFDLEAIRKRLDDVEAYLIIDGTQSVGALPFLVDKVKPDALIVAGYKWLMGPYGMGFGYYNERFDNGKPIENNWITRLHSEDFAGLVNYQDKYKPAASRYSVGESSNFIAINMLRHSVAMIRNWGPENIQNYCGNIIEEAVSALRNKGFRMAPSGQRSNHLFGIKIPSYISVDALKEVFGSYNIYVSIRGDYIRVAPFVFNEKSDVEKLAEVLMSH